MNAIQTPTTHPIPTPAVADTRIVPFPDNNRLVAREREFGTGYGRSSGYSTQRRYASDWAQPRFRFA